MSAQTGGKPGPTARRGPARQALADAVRGLLTAAPGTLHEIGQRMRPPRDRQRLSEWQTGQRLPQVGDLHGLLQACIPAGLPPAELRRRWNRLRRLLAAAQAEPDSNTAASPRTTIVVGSVPPRAAAFQHREVANHLLAAVQGGGTAVVTHRALPEAVAQPVVSGLGGVGKTQLAAALVHDLTAEHAAEHTVELVVWVSASSRAGIVTGYADAAHALQLPVGAGDPERAARLFLAALATRRQRWLVVLDDLTRPADVRDLWPPSSEHGATVVTTRRRDASLLAGRTLVDVDVFTADEAHAYLRERLPDHLADDVTGLAEDLGHLPLALDHATAYLLDLQTLTCAGYRIRFAEQHRRLETLFPDPETLFTRPAHTVATTWALSITRADQLRPVGVAGRLAELLSVLDPAGVPAVVLTTAPAKAYLNPHQHGTPADDEVEDGLANLRRFSLISAGTTIRVHALVQRAVRDTLPGDRIDAIAVTAADALLATWPEVERDTELTGRLRANAGTVYHHRPDALVANQVHRLLFRANRSLADTGLVSAARDDLEQLHHHVRDRLGADHPDAMTTRNNLAGWRGEAGDPAGAAAAFAELLTDQLRVLGPDHPEIVNTRNNLAHFRGRAGDPAGAAIAFAELVEDRLRALGADHPHTLNARGNLARWRGQAGDLRGAAAATAELLTDQLRVLGPDHPDTLTTRANLAHWQAESGDPAGAAAACAELLTDRLRVLGPEHPDTLTTRSGLAEWRGQAGDKIGAVAAFTELLTDRLRVLGPDHPDTLNTRHNVASWQGEAGDPAGAAAAFAELLPDMLRVLGPDHPATLDARHNVATWKGQAGDPAGAVAAFVELLTDVRRVLGPDHPDTLVVRGHLARWRGVAGDRSGAADAFAELLTDRLRILGPDHPVTLTTRNNLAMWQGAAGDPAGAAAATAELLTDMQRVLGPDHLDTLNTRVYLAHWRKVAGPG